MIAALKREKKYIILIMLFYLLSQGLVLFISGLWYDDWCMINISSEGLKLWASEMGRPEVYPIFSFVNHVPAFISKLIVFIGYYSVAILFFMITQKCFAIDDKEAFCLTMIYLCMPVNDIRVAHAVIPYVLGLVFFFVALYIFVYRYEALTIGYRIIVLVLFFFSYILNSLLLFMGLVWLYIILKERTIKNLARKTDFFALPFIYFGINHVFFPSHGAYFEYNKVTIKKMISALKETFIAESSLVGQIISVFQKTIVTYPIILLVIFLATWLLINKTKGGDEDNRSNNNQLEKTIAIEATIGLIALFVGLYPYVVVGNFITITGFDSRNVTVSAFGITLIIHAFFSIGFKRELRNVVVLVMMIISALHFYNSYSNYQCIYYVDKGLQEYLSSNLELKEYKNIGVIEGDGGASWYMYNGMFEEVFGDENRLVENVNYTMTVDPSIYGDCISREWYNMTGCDISYKTVDCVIIYTNNLTPQKAISARIHELMGKDISGEIIKDSSFRIIYPYEEEFLNYIVQ